MPSRNDRREQELKNRRQGRLAAAERHRRQQLIKRAVVIAAAVLAIGVVGWIGYTIIDDQRQQSADKEQLGDVQTFDLEAGHVSDPVTYEQNPPVGGPHFNSWQNCSYYGAPIVNEYAVHSLEHGAVWITYRPDLPADQVEILREMAESQTFLLVSPYPEDLPAPVVASSWERQLLLESATDEGLEAFVRVNKQGPNTPELGASCTSNITTTR